MKLKVLLPLLFVTAVAAAQTNSGPANFASINSTLYVGAATGWYPTIQATVTAACAVGHKRNVRIPAGYLGSDTISGVTGGCTDANLFDDRATPVACYTWSGSAYTSAACGAGSSVTAAAMQTAVAGQSGCTTAGQSWVPATNTCIAGGGTAFQANGTPLTSSSTVNFQSGVGGIGVTNPSAGVVRFDISIVPIANGGTGSNSFLAHTFFGNSTGSTGTPGQTFLGASDVSPPSYISGFGSVNVMTATLFPAATSLATGLQAWVKPNLANTTTTPTLNVNSLGAVTVKKAVGGSIVALSAGDYVSAIPAHFLYDGTEWLLLNPQIASQPSGGATGDLCGSYPGPTVCGTNGTAIPALASVVGTNSSGQLITPSPGSNYLPLGGVSGNPVWTLMSGDCFWSSPQGTIICNKTNGSSFTPAATATGTPSLGQVPSATSSTTAAWQNPTTCATTNGLLFVGSASVKPACAADVVYGGAGGLVLTATTTATSGANVSSAPLYWFGSIWTGSSGVLNEWSAVDVPGSGPNPTDTLTFTHVTGTSGRAAVSYPNIQDLGITGSQQAVEADSSGNFVGVAKKPRSIAFQYGTPGGTSITAGIMGYLTVPYACTITGWQIQADAGTATIKFLKVAAGTSIPTLLSNSINTSGVSLSTNTVIQSTTLTDFTTTTVTAGDILAADLITVATAGYVSGQLTCQ
jgi:hypothetical protein